MIYGGTKSGGTNITKTKPKHKKKTLTTKKVEHNWTFG